MEPKRECTLAVTQILHLHLYKTSSPVCLSGYPLSLFVSLISRSFSLSLSFHSMCCGLGRCHFQHVFYTLCTLCVNCDHPWGSGERWGEPVWEQPCQVLWYDSAWSYRHLVCLKGKRKVDLAFFFILPLPSLRFLFDLSLAHFHTLFLCLCYPRALVKAAAVQRAHRHPTFPAQPYLIHHGRILATVCMFPNVLDVEKAQTLRVSHIETICPGGLRPQHQLIMLNTISRKPKVDLFYCIFCSFLFIDLFR